jgi:RNA polymerase sigma factor (TIGR02999 family)
MAGSSDKSSSGAVTRLLRAAESGDTRAAADLLPLMYSELRSLARSLMANVPPGNTLDPTALVHEAYLRLVRKGDGGWNSRGHFFGAAAKAMRQILVDQARRKAAVKRGGDLKRVDGDVELAIAAPSNDVLALDRALSRLEHEDPRAALVVSLRFFAGLTAEETATAMDVSLSTVEREWRFARALLWMQLREGEE